MKIKIDKKEKDEILKNIKWFKKFSLEKRLRISGTDTKSIETLRSLSICGLKKHV